MVDEMPRFVVPPVKEWAIPHDEFMQLIRFIDELESKLDDVSHMTDLIKLEVASNDVSTARTIIHGARLRDPKWKGKKVEEIK